MQTPHGAEYRSDSNVPIPLRDGTVLAGSVYQLAGDEVPRPVILDMYPYHKEALIGSAVEYARLRFVDRGYTSVLVEFRGTGRSRGEVIPAFHNDEGVDALDVVEWVAAQPWCDGRVGMCGISYGAITAFKVAALKPPALKAIVPLMGTGNVYSDFLFPGAIPNALGRQLWGSYELMLEASPTVDLPPSGEWRGVWAEHLERFERAELAPVAWHRNSAPNHEWDEFAVDLAQIETPTFLIGGWADVYPSILEDFARMPAPKTAVMGPWTHGLPDLAARDQWDWHDEVADWLDTWLKDERGSDPTDGVLVYVQGAGAWRKDAEWPPRDHQVTRWHLVEGHALSAAHAASAGYVDYAADPTVGADGPLMDPMGTGMGYALDQNRDAAKSLTFRTPEVDETVDITGRAEAQLLLECVEGGAFDLVVKLHDVAPDGLLRFIAAGHQHFDAESIAPGSRAVRTVRLNDTCYRLRAGHRMQMSIAMADFPYVFPGEVNKTLRVWWGGNDSEVSCLQVPSSRPTSDHRTVPLVEDQDRRLPWSRNISPYWRITEDLVGDAVRHTYGFEQGLVLPSGARYDLSVDGDAEVARSRPKSATVTCSVAARVTQCDGTVIEVRTESVGQRSAFRFTTTAVENDNEVFRCSGSA